MKLFITFLLIAISASAALAQNKLPPPPPTGQPYGQAAEQAIEATRRLSYITSQRAYVMNPTELNQFNQLLQTAELLVLNAGSDNQFGFPQCKIQGYGTYRGYSWNYLIMLNGDIIDAANELPEAISKLDVLQSSGVCARPFAVNDTCAVTGYSTYRGYSWNYTITLNGSVLDAANDFTVIKTKLESLNQAGLCRSIPQQKCSLQGYGTYRNYSWNFLVFIGKNIVDADNEAAPATARLNELRQLGLCF